MRETARIFGRNVTTATLTTYFAVQDEITLVLATEMQVKLTEGEQARLRYTTTKKWRLEPLGGGPVHYRRSISKENVGAARAC